MAVTDSITYIETGPGLAVVVIAPLMGTALVLAAALLDRREKRAHGKETSRYAPWAMAGATLLLMVHAAFQGAVFPVNLLQGSNTLTAMEEHYGVPVEKVPDPGDLPVYTINGTRCTATQEVTDLDRANGVKTLRIDVVCDEVPLIPR